MPENNLLLGCIYCGLASITVIMAIPLISKKIPMNRWYGFRFKLSFESEANWYLANRIGGIILAAYSLPLICAGISSFFILPEITDAMMTPMALIVPVLYLVAALHAYVLARRKVREG